MVYGLFRFYIKPTRYKTEPHIYTYKYYIIYVQNIYINILIFLFIRIGLLFSYVPYQYQPHVILIQYFRILLVHQTAIFFIIFIPCELFLK